MKQVFKLNHFFFSLNRIEKEKKISNWGISNEMQSIPHLADTSLKSGQPTIVYRFKGMK